MNNEDKIYKELQQHLDRQPVGYPATRSGVECRILKQLFTPGEARLALKLSYRAQTASRIHQAMEAPDLSVEAVAQQLGVMAKKLIIGRVERAGDNWYYLLPFVVGMYEGRLNKLTPEFMAAFDEYTRDKAFGLSFLATELPQMRTIPVGKSITPRHHVATYDQLDRLLAEAEGPFVITTCICRQAARLRGKTCRKTQRTETCLVIGDTAKSYLDAGLGREIDRAEALAISRQNEADGLVPQPNNARKTEFICACCGCCCGILAVHKKIPHPLEFWASNFFAEVDPDACTGCGTCEDRCEVDAISVDDAGEMAIIQLDRCIGCGNCVPTCPAEALSLAKKDTEVTPPESTEELHEIIMSNKKGKLGKLKLAARLFKKR